VGWLIFMPQNVTGMDRFIHQLCSNQNFRDAFFATEKESQDRIEFIENSGFKLTTDEINALSKLEISDLEYTITIGTEEKTYSPWKPII
jgi:hypothetical protein